MNRITVIWTKKYCRARRTLLVDFWWSKGCNLQNRSRFCQTINAKMPWSRWKLAQFWAFKLTKKHCSLVAIPFWGPKMPKNVPGTGDNDGKNANLANYSRKSAIFVTFFPPTSHYYYADAYNSSSVLQESHMDLGMQKLQKPRGYA